MLLCQNSHVLEHIEGKESKIFVIKIRKVNLTKPEFYIGKGFLSFSFTSMYPGPRIVPVI